MVQFMFDKIVKFFDGRCASRISAPEMKMERAGQ